MKEIIKKPKVFQKSLIIRAILLASLVPITGTTSVIAADTNGVAEQKAEGRSEIIPTPLESNKVNKREMKMNVNDVQKALKSICQYEIDGSFLFSQAIENITNKDIQKKLVSFKDECEGYITELSDLIRKLGEDPPSHGRDFKGFFMQGYAAMRGLVSDEGVLKALETNTKTILKAYEDTLILSLPEEYKAMLQRIYNAKKKHLDYIANQAIHSD